MEKPVSITASGGPKIRALLKPSRAVDVDMMCGPRPTLGGSTDDPKSADE
jgi:hypothetical protein